MLPVIEARQVSKCYNINASRPRYLSLRDSLASLSFLRKARKEEFWALKDVSFSVGAGESLGIIGRNGAGKSTLLKVLSQITPPTRGSAVIRGRMASLLEIGTGFHPELNGRDNIYLNGSLLGLRRSEIKRRFDQIVDFSGMEKFLETPLKFYSSGMQLRLAFSVAAFIEPEVLLLDEVLAVGDAEFQRKGLKKMEEVSSNGRTILFVSHDLAAVRQLCRNSLVLEAGSVFFAGDSDAAVSAYLNKVRSESSATWLNEVDPEDSQVFLRKITIGDARLRPRSEFLSSEEIFLSFHTVANTQVSRFTIGFDLYKDGVHLVRSRQVDAGLEPFIGKGERHVFRCRLPAWYFNEGVYSIRPFVAVHFLQHLSRVHDTTELSFEVQMDRSRSPLHYNLNAGNQPGVLFTMFDWQYSAADEP